MAIQNHGYILTKGNEMHICDNQTINLGDAECSSDIVQTLAYTKLKAWELGTTDQLFVSVHPA